LKTISRSTIQPYKKKTKKTLTSQNKTKLNKTKATNKQKILFKKKSEEVRKENKKINR